MVGVWLDSWIVDSWLGVNEDKRVTYRQAAEIVRALVRERWMVSVSQFVSSRSGSGSGENARQFVLVQSTHFPFVQSVLQLM